MGRDGGGRGNQWEGGGTWPQDAMCENAGRDPAPPCRGRLCRGGRAGAIEAGKPPLTTYPLGAKPDPTRFLLKKNIPPPRRIPMLIGGPGWEADVAGPLHVADPVGVLLQRHLEVPRRCPQRPRCVHEPKAHAEE